MQLPVRIVERAPREPVISVDGAFDAPGLNLSHWPGNKTPRALKHDLSAGIGLAFARLAPAEQRALAAGATAIVNNHYDTDGLCALLAVARPAAALARADALLAAAAAGDLFQLPSEAAFVVDAIVTGVVDLERSPWRAMLAGASDRERWERAALRALDELPDWLDGRVEDYATLWREPLERLRADRAALAAAARDELVHLDLCVWTAPAQSREFDPGRHALFGATTSDRVLVLGPSGRGTRARFVVGTYSWFDLVTRRAQPRPDLAALATRLNELEGTRAAEQCAWRAQPADGPSPELWFGFDSLERFAEHAGDALAPSALDPLRIKAEVLDALRAAWVFPDEDEAALTP